MYISWPSTKCKTQNIITPATFSTEADAKSACSNNANCKAIYSTDCSSDFKLCNDVEDLLASPSPSECVQEIMKMSSKI